MKHLLIFTIAIVIFAVPLESSGAEGLDEAWAITLRVNERLQAAQEKVAAANCNVDAARRQYRPSLTNKTGYTFLSDEASFQFSGQSFDILDQQFATTSLMAKMPLYTGGRIQSGVDAAGCTLSAAQSDVEQTVLDLKLEVATAYVRVLRAQRGLEVAEAAVRSLEAHEDVIQTKLNRGDVPKNDLLAAQVELANASQDKIRARNQLLNAKAMYNRLLGRSLESPVDIEELTVPPPSDQLEPLVEQALRLRPELAALSAQASALQHQANVKRAATRPQFGVEGGLMYLESSGIDPNAYGTFSFGLEWTPYDGGTSESSARALQREAVSVQNLRRDAAQAIQLQVHNRWRDEQESRQQVTVATQAVEQAEENLRVAKVQFAEGAAINTVVLDAETLRSRAYRNYYDAVYGAVLATFRLRRAIGSL